MRKLTATEYAAIDGIYFERQDKSLEEHAAEQRRRVATRQMKKTFFYTIETNYASQSHA